MPKACSAPSEAKQNWVQITSLIQRTRGRDAGLFSGTCPKIETSHGLTSDSRYPSLPPSLPLSKRWALLPSCPVLAS